MDKHANDFVRYLGYALQSARAGNFFVAGASWADAMTTADKIVNGEVRTRADTLCMAFAGAMIVVTGRGGAK